MLTIDGSQGEGGGQILRTALALSVLTRTPFRLGNIRAGRSKPGLMRQHLTAVNAAAAIGDATVRGGEIGSTTLEFVPRALVPGEYRFSVGSAGSATLVLQTVLPALLQANAPSRLVFEGGTHNPMAPTFDYLDRVFLPLLEKMGVVVERKLERHGFYPAGGGRFTIVVHPTAALRPLHLLARGEVRSRRATAVFTASVPFDVARRELDTIKTTLGFGDDELHPLQVEAAGPGNALCVELASEHVTEQFTAFAERGVRAEDIAGVVAREASAYLATGAPVGEHLADQLLLPLALAGGGSFRTVAPTPHTTTQADVIGYFLGNRVRSEAVDAATWHFEIVK